MSKRQLGTGERESLEKQSAFMYESAARAVKGFKPYDAHFLRGVHSGFFESLKDISGAPHLRGKERESQEYLQFERYILQEVITGAAIRRIALLSENGGNDNQPGDTRVTRDHLVVAIRDKKVPLSFITDGAREMAEAGDFEGVLSALRYVRREIQAP